MTEFARLFLALGAAFAIGLFYGVFAGAALAYGLMHHPPHIRDLGRNDAV